MRRSTRSCRLYSTQQNPDVDSLLKAVNVKIQALIEADPDQAGDQAARH